MSVHDETPAETIRRAIEQMREAANVAWADGDLGWFEADEIVGIFERAREPRNSRTGSDAAYIASWHPAVVLATADLLEGIADGHARILAMFPPDLLPSNVTAVYGFDAALRLARTYLGETP